MSVVRILIAVVVVFGLIVSVIAAMVGVATHDWLMVGVCVAAIAFLLWVLYHVVEG